MPGEPPHIWAPGSYWSLTMKSRPIRERSYYAQLTHKPREEPQIRGNLDCIPGWILLILCLLPAILYSHSFELGIFFGVFLILQPQGIAGIFRLRLQKPIIERYYSEGRKISATVISRRDDQRKRKKNFYEVLIEYQPDFHNSSVLHAKRIAVEGSKFDMDTLDILVLPGIVSSAVLRSALDLKRARPLLEIGLLLIISPAVWFTIIVINMSDPDFVSSYLWWAVFWFVFGLSWVGTFCIGWGFIEGENYDMLYGDMSSPVDVNKMRDDKNDEESGSVCLPFDNSSNALMKQAY